MPAETKQKEENKKAEKEAASHPGGPYPWSLHGYYTDMKGRTWNPCKCDHQSWAWLGRPHTIKYNYEEPFPNGSVVLKK